MNDNNSAGSGTGAAGDAARDRAAGDRAASGRAANDRTEAAKAAKAEEKAAKREAQKAAQEAAAAKRAEKKAAKKAKREAESAQKKKQKEAVKESDEDAADGQSEGVAPLAAQGETKETDALPAKVVKGKKPKKSRQAKSSSPKEIRRAIRPIRSKSQQTTARLIWAVFGMALVIVAIAGFWFVLNSQEDTTEIEVLVAAKTLIPGSQLERDDVITETIDLQDATISYVPASELGTLVGQTILYEVNQEDLLTFGVFVDSPLGALDGEEGSGSQNEIEFQIEFPGTVTFPEEDVWPGTRVVIFAVQPGSAEQPGSRFAFEVVDIARGGGNAAGGESEAGGGNEIYLRGSYEYRAWWEKNFTEAYSSGGVSFELEIPRPADSSIDTLCWRERFRTIYGVGALSPEAYRALIEQLECPEAFLGSLSEGPSSTTEGDDTEPGAGASETSGTEGDDTEPDDQPNIAERLESERFSADREVPDEFIAPAAPSGEESGALPEFNLPSPPGFPDV